MATSTASGKLMAIPIMDITKGTRLRRLVVQAALLTSVALAIWYFVGNIAANLASQNVASGFGFLHHIANIPIGETVIPYDAAVNTYGYALLIGVINTLKMAIAGIVLATLIGTFVGICRVSKIWILSVLARSYIEVLRNVPVLLQLFFWYALFQVLPPPREAVSIGNSVFISDRGIRFPLLVWDRAHTLALAAFILCATACFLYRKWQRESGRPPFSRGAGIAASIAAASPIWIVLGAPLALDVPELRGFNFVGGGNLSREYASLVVALSVYTAAFIAEIVRAGIENVPRGQREAGLALGLSSTAIMLLIVLPQTLRVVVPPITSQYLHLIKNSSLGIAIGYQDIVSIANTTLNQTGQAIESVMIIMAAYLSVSLFVSALMNRFNARVVLKER